MRHSQLLGAVRVISVCNCISGMFVLAMHWKVGIKNKTRIRPAGRYCMILRCSGIRPSLCPTYGGWAYLDGHSLKVGMRCLILG